VGPDLSRVLGEALDARQRSGGRFDPTVHGALVAAGYDRDLPEVPADDPRPAGAPAPAGGAVALDLLAGEVHLSEGVAIDLGGVAKGDAADRACAILAAAGPALACLGGDIAVSGPRTDGSGWPVAVEGAGLVVLLAGGGLATSGRDRRTWRRGGAEMHHVIDPVTGRPAGTDLLRVTVAAPSAARAETLATDLLLLGAEAARRRADDLGCPAVLVTAAGGTTLAGGLA
jgi:thiamine biosynthesis lipoprotein